MQTGGIRGEKNAISTASAERGARSTAIGHVKTRMSGGLGNRMRLFLIQ